MDQSRYYLRVLVEEIHSAIVATIDKEGHPVTRAIDIMLCDKQGVYFLTAKGKDFYRQLIEQRYIALSAVKDGKAISLRGYVDNIGKEKLDEIFRKNPYMQKIYPGDTREALEVFCLSRASGEYFYISNPDHVFRDRIAIGAAEETAGGYYIGKSCTGCASCMEVCPQKCIEIASKTAVIDQHHCLHCGRCAEVCPAGAIERR